MIDPGHELSVSTQCRLLGVSRSSYYHECANVESEENLALMEVIDRFYLAHPENGSRMMVRVLRRATALRLYRGRRSTPTWPKTRSGRR